jgi:hypothetical protein
MINGGIKHGERENRALRDGQREERLKEVEGQGYGTVECSYRRKLSESVWAVLGVGMVARQSAKSYMDSSGVRGVERGQGGAR